MKRWTIPDHHLPLTTWVYLWAWRYGTVGLVEFINKKTVSVRCSVKTAEPLKWFSNLAENLANYGQFYWSITLFSVNHTGSRQTTLILAADWSDLGNRGLWLVNHWSFRRNLTASGKYVRNLGLDKSDITKSHNRLIQNMKGDMINMTSQHLKQFA